MMPHDSTEEPDDEFWAGFRRRYTEPHADDDFVNSFRAGMDSGVADLRQRVDDGMALVTDSGGHVTGMTFDATGLVESIAEQARMDAYGRIWQHVQEMDRELNEQPDDATTTVQFARRLHGAYLEVLGTYFTSAIDERYSDPDVEVSLATLELLIRYSYPWFDSDEDDDENERRLTSFETGEEIWPPGPPPSGL